MKLADTLRTLFKIRKRRQTPPAGPKPPIGTTIVREKLKMRLKHPINNEQWEWLTLMGWRAIDTRKNRRHYISVSENDFVKLIHASSQERDALHETLILTASTQTNIANIKK